MLRGSELGKAETRVLLFPRDPVVPNLKYDEDGDALL